MDPNPIIEVTVQHSFTLQGISSDAFMKDIKLINAFRATIAEMFQILIDAVQVLGTSNVVRSRQRRFLSGSEDKCQVQYEVRTTSTTKAEALVEQMTNSPSISQMTEIFSSKIQQDPQMSSQYSIKVIGSSKPNIATNNVNQANATDDNNDNVVENDDEKSSPVAGILLVLFLLGVGGFISCYIFKQKNKENEIVTTFNNNSFSSPKEIECVIFNADYFQKEVETRTNKKMMNDALLLWLNELNLGDHYLTFIEEELESISDLRLLSDEHFKKLGLELSDRRKIRAHVLLYMQDEHCSAKQDYDDFSLPKPDDDFSLPKPEIKK